MAIFVVAEDDNKRGDLFNERMKDLVHALGYEVTRTNIHKPGRELDIVAKHSLEDRRAVIECKAKKEKIGGGDINKFVGAMDVERREGESLSGYFISTSGFTDSAVEQESSRRNRVALLGPKEIQAQLQRGRIVVSLRTACYKAGRLNLGPQPWKVDDEADLVAHSSGWLWRIHFKCAGERKAYTLIHADGSFPSRAAGRSIAKYLEHNSSARLAYIEGEPEMTDDDIADVRESYFEYVSSEYGEFTLEGFPVDQHLGSKSIELEELYIPQFLEKVEKIDLDADNDEDKNSARRERHPVRKILEDYKAITVLGSPGSGKSTLVKRLATSYANARRRDRISDGLPDNNWLPLVIKCREIRSAAEATIIEMLGDIPRRAEMSSGGEAFGKLISQVLRDGSALLLVDGLDEFADTSGRAGFLRKLKTFMSRYPLCTVLVTSRETGFREVAGFVSEHFVQYRVSELSNDEITSLTIAWHRQAHGRNASVLSRAETLAARIIETDRVRRLAVNPLLLTTLLLVQRWVGDLPRKRSVLYEKAIELLLMTWNVEGYDPLDLDEAKPHLAYLAHAMTSSGQQQVSQDEMLSLFQEARDNLPEVLGYSKLRPRDLLQRIELRSSLVAQIGHAVHNGKLQPTYEFKHLTFQEYLTATAIAQGWHVGAPVDGQHLDAIKQHVLDSRWHEVIALYGVLAGRRGKLLIEYLCDSIDEILTDLASSAAGDEREPYDLRLVDLTYLTYQCLDDEVQAPPELADRALDLLIPTLEDTYFDGIITSRYGEQLLQKAREEILHASFGDSPCIPILTRLFFVSLPQVADPTDVVSRLEALLDSGDVTERVGALGSIMSLAYWRFGGFEEFRNGNLDEVASVQIAKECIPAVLKCIHDPHVVVRFTSLWALSWTARSVVFESTRQVELLPTLMEIFFDDPDGGVRRMAGWALVEIMEYENASNVEISPDRVPILEEHLLAHDSHELRASLFLCAVSDNGDLMRMAKKRVQEEKHKAEFENKLLEFLTR
ncbi:MULTISPECIES: restriction endonuclease [unclassified Streptomyces]|uniref:restriction endonuclease n=1 Tax=unclassified Streptomyces TaxID=2593676 RepID=UPI0011B0B543|nr:MULTISPECIES: restriction endonuclease [unclassified Streptomyces]